MQSLSVFDIILFPLFVGLIFVVARIIKNKYKREIPSYKYFTLGLFIKILGLLGFISIYLFYYGGGDTTNYFICCKAIGNLLLDDFEKGFAILFNTKSPYNNYSSFNASSGWPEFFMWKDEKAFSVARYTTIFYLIGLKSFLITSLLVCCFTYIGAWKFYRLFTSLYPGYEKLLAGFILLMPSLLFWGGGIMKDSYTVNATCWLTYNFYMVFILGKKRLVNLSLLLVNVFIILSIKPYVILSLLPGVIIWLNNAYLKKIRRKILRILIVPILSSSIFYIGLYTFENLSSLLGVYGNVDTAIEQAQVIQSDLTRANQYGENYYNIGTLDGSTSGLLQVAPLAIFTALFRPFIWEVGSPTMLLSAIENFCLLVYVLITLMKVSPYSLFRTILREPFLMYCLIFSLIFAFGVGVAGTNFGAMVRYKTPLVPFFFSLVYVSHKITKKEKNYFR